MTLAALPRVEPRGVPSAHDAEVALLCCVLANPTTAQDLVHLVAVQDFASDHHGFLWRAVSAVVAARALPDPILVQRELDRLAVPDPKPVADLAREYAASAFSPSNGESYAGVVREQARLRALAAAAAGVRSAIEDGQRLDDVLDRLSSAVHEAQDAIHPPAVSLVECLQEAIDDLNPDAEPDGISSGFLALDELAGPIAPGQFVLVGARPSMGKSAFALNVAYHVAATAGPVLFLSLEMPKKQLAFRLLCQVSGVPYDVFTKRGRFINDTQRSHIAEARGLLKDLPILIDDTPAQSPDAIHARVKRHVERDGLRLVVVDFLGIVRPPSGRTVNSRENEIGVISRSLRATAREFGVPMLALAQLNRESDSINRSALDASRTKPPVLSDLRDSGSLEQDADQVWFIHRPGYYTKRADELRLAEIHVAKNRYGQVGMARLQWFGSAQRFTDEDV